MNKKIITGASGAYGRRAATLLLQTISPSELILTSRKPEKLADFAKIGVEVRYADFDEPDSLAGAFAGGAQMLMISTMQVGRRSAQHGRALEAAKKAGVEHIVYTSFVGIDEHNPALVITDHRQTEELIKESGLAYTFLRDSQYAEALVTIAAVRAAEQGLWVSSAAEGKVALVAHDDCVQCAAAVLAGQGHENTVYHITGPELLSFRDMAEMAAKISGRPVDYRVVSDEKMYEFFAQLGVPLDYEEGMNIAKAGKWSSRDMVSFEQAIREGYFAVISRDVEKLLGREPTPVWEVYQQHKALFTS